MSARWLALATALAACGGAARAPAPVVAHDARFAAGASWRFRMTTGDNDDVAVRTCRVAASGADPGGGTWSQIDCDGDDDLPPLEGTWIDAPTGVYRKEYDGSRRLWLANPPAEGKQTQGDGATRTVTHDGERWCVEDESRDADDENTVETICFDRVGIARVEVDDIGDRRASTTQLVREAP